MCHNATTNVRLSSTNTKTTVIRNSYQMHKICNELQLTQDCQCVCVILLTIQCSGTIYHKTKFQNSHGTDSSTFKQFICFERLSRPWNSEKKLRIFMDFQGVTRIVLARCQQINNENDGRLWLVSMPHTTQHIQSAQLAICMHFPCNCQHTSLTSIISCTGTQNILMSICLYSTST